MLLLLLLGKRYRIGDLTRERISARNAICTFTERGRRGNHLLQHASNTCTHMLSLSSFPVMSHSQGQLLFLWKGRSERAEEGTDLSKQQREEVFKNSCQI